MLSWLVDNATVVYLPLGLAGLALTIGWWMTRENKYLLGVGIILVLLFVVWLLARLVVTDRTRLRLIIEEMAQAIENNKPEVIVQHLSRDFNYNGINKAAIGGYISRAIRDYNLQYVGVWEFDFEQLSRPEGRATVAFRTKVDLGSDRSMWVCRGYFVLEDGQWRMKGFNIYNPVVNTDQPIQIPLR
jgi:hypothetical protein